MFVSVDPPDFTDSLDAEDLSSSQPPVYTDHLAASVSSQCDSESLLKNTKHKISPSRSTKQQSGCDFCAESECDCDKNCPLRTSTLEPVVIEDRDFNSTQEQKKVLENIEKDLQLIEKFQSKF